MSKKTITRAVLLAAIITVIVVVSVMVMTVSAASDVAEVTTASGVTTRYTNYQAAFDYAKTLTEPCTLKLLEGNNFMDLSVTFTGWDSLCDITLDLNGKTIANNDSNYERNLFTFEESTNARLTVMNGEIKYTRAAEYSAFRMNGGTLIVRGDNTIIRGDDTRTGNLIYIDGGSVTLESGTFGYDGYYGGSVTPVYFKSGWLNISGGSFISGLADALKVDKDYKKGIKISGGTFKTGSQNAYAVLVENGGAVNQLLSSEGRYFWTDGKGTKLDGSVSGLRGSVAVEQDPPVCYWGTQTQGELYCYEYTLFDNNITTLSDGFYVVENEHSVGTLYVSGNVTLILCDGARLNCTNIVIVGNSELELFGQWEGTGTLSCVSKDPGTSAISIAKDCYGFLYITSATLIVEAPEGTPGVNVGDDQMRIHDADGIKIIETLNPENTDAELENDQGISVTATRCNDHEWKYNNFPKLDEEKHQLQCLICNWGGGWEAHNYNDFKSCDDNYHQASCICGAVSPQEAHHILYSHGKDGLTHTGKCRYCGYTVPKTEHTYDDAGQCICGAKHVVTYNGVKYARIQPALDIAAKENGVLTLLADVFDNVIVNDGNVTIDLNGKEWMADLNTEFLADMIPLSINGGSVTLKNGTLAQGSAGATACSAAVITGGHLTLGEGMTVIGSRRSPEKVNPAIDLQGGELTLSVGTVLEFGMRVPEGKCLADYLPEGTALYYLDGSGAVTSNVVPDEYTVRENFGDFALAEHTHAFADSACGCGFVCKNHNYDDNGYCTVCRKLIPTRLIAEDGTTLGHGKFEDMLMEVQPGSGCTIKLFEDTALSSTLLPDKLTLDLNGKTLTLGSSGTNIAVSGNVTVKNGKISGSGDLPILNVMGTLTLDADVINTQAVKTAYATMSAEDNENFVGMAVKVSSGKLIMLGGTIEGGLYVAKGAEVELSGGTIRNDLPASTVTPRGTVVQLDGGGSVGRFLKVGYAYKDVDGNAIDISEAPASIEGTVSISRCEPHRINPETGKCIYCNADCEHSVAADQWVIDVTPAFGKEGRRHGRCTICTAEVTEILPAVDFDTVTLYHNCSFGNDLSMLYAILSSNLEGCTDIRLVVEKVRYNGNTPAGTVSKTLYPTVLDIGGKAYYRFDYSEVCAKELGDTLTASLVFVRDGNEYSGKVDTYSLKQYAMERLANSTDDTFRTLVLELLNYGAAAQTYFAYRTDALVNSDIPDEYLTLARGGYDALVGVERGGDTTVYPFAIKASNIVFGNRIELLVATSIENESDLEGVALRICYTDYSGAEVEKLVDGTSFVYRSDVGGYTVCFDGLLASEFRTKLSLTLVRNSEPVSGSVNYSLETYAKNRLEGTVNEHFKALLEQTLVYSDSARDYFGRTSD